MTPEKWIGHSAFRRVESTKYPPAGEFVFYKWLQHRDGTIVFYTRGILPLGIRESGDIEAADVFGDGNACHCCVCSFGDGRLLQNGELSHHWSTTARRFRESPWGNLCQHCRQNKANEAYEAFRKRIEFLGVEPEMELV